MGVKWRLAHSIPSPHVGTKFIKQSHYKLDKVQYCVGEPRQERERDTLYERKNDLKANMTSVSAYKAAPRN